MQDTLVVRSLSAVGIIVFREAEQRTFVLSCQPKKGKYHDSQLLDNASISSILFYAARDKPEEYSVKSMTGFLGTLDNTSCEANGLDSGLSDLLLLVFELSSNLESYFSKYHRLPTIRKETRQIRTTLIGALDVNSQIKNESAMLLSGLIYPFHCVYQEQTVDNVGNQVIFHAIQSLLRLLDTRQQLYQTMHADNAAKLKGQLEIFRHLHFGGVSSVNNDRLDTLLAVVCSPGLVNDYLNIVGEGRTLYEHIMLLAISIVRRYRLFTGFASTVTQLELPSSEVAGFNCKTS
jgi:hypothetical protein